ncbi:MAG: N-glycosylase/DNA lyase [Candidatus Lokiarchaeota archaeon]|nr:N-glycosylase/DNA lyase [Candidatus Lokiarchaeota archaeon]
MQDLRYCINNLKKSKVNHLIQNRIREFSEIREESLDTIFGELCFCIMTANCSAEKCIEVQAKIGNGFKNLDQKGLAEKLKKFGYRFPNIRAEYIVKARDHKEELKKNLSTNTNLKELREWIVKNIKGIGYKEASHFLRNIGYTGYAIVDFHIIDLLTKYNIITKPKTLTRKMYLEIEEKLSKIAEELSLNLGELDLFMWYLETGKILK